ncbi:MAG: DUF2585 family protein [Xanthobacteraceae bacterium]|nr:DUF2585 family protein [Xanthobacteraceae bacterium]PWB58054.1 MAG: hypothetical protein C3F17_19370 [Bradyrhizobiaceae bacterium]
MTFASGTGPVQPAPRIPAGWLAVIAGLVALQAAVILGFGHPLICTCGSVDLWHGNASGPQTSQHLTDWYSFSHVIHGFVFYLLLWLVAPRASFGLRLALAVGIEAAWEIVENTPLIMERYRQSALARGYFGDSVINSAADTLAMVLGFVLARLLPVWSAVALVVGMELFTLVMIRDNLVLNIVQLLAPNEALSRWQAGE